VLRNAANPNGSTLGKDMQQAQRIIAKSAAAGLWRSAELLLMNRMRKKLVAAITPMLFLVFPDVSQFLDLFGRRCTPAAGARLGGKSCSTNKPDKNHRDSPF
jgi:hypothetical protein